MKRLISLMVTVLFVCTSVVPIMAEATETEVPSISVTVPENIETPLVQESFFENFDESTDAFTKNGYNTGLFSIIEDSDNPGNKVLEYNLKGAKTVAQYGGTIRTTTFAYPSGKVPYTVSFNFKKTGVCNSGDALWVQTRSDEQYTCLRIDLSQFEKDKWYTVKYVTKGNGTPNSAATAVCTKTLRSTGETTSLSCNVTTGWTSQKNNVCITTYNKAGNGYAADAATGTTPWSNVAFQIDDFSLTYEKTKAIETKLDAGDPISGNVLPMLVAHDENGVLTAFAEGSAAINGNEASANFDIMGSLSAFQKAKSVKVLYWDTLSSAKPYASGKEIGDSISRDNSTSGFEVASIDVTSDMLPENARGNYTLFAYTVPFTASGNNIPQYDSLKHTVIAIDQSNTRITEFKYDKSLWNTDKQDVVVVCNADGASEAKSTIIEVNDAPQFTNVSMLLGSDLSERNFTWFSLSSDDGKITYEKVDTMVDGEFSDGAMVVNATREHDSSVYSKKEYYYQNKAVIKGLEPDTEYCYQLSNGKNKHQKVYFSTGKDDTSFSFAFGGDPQVGGNDNGDYAQEALDWGRTLNQITTAPEFDGIEFFVSAGDQIESAGTGELIEAQYDIYLNHDEFLSLPQAVVLGNHDHKQLR